MISAPSLYLNMVFEKWISHTWISLDQPNLNPCLHVVMDAPTPKRVAAKLAGS